MHIYSFEIAHITHSSLFQIIIVITAMKLCLLSPKKLKRVLTIKEHAKLVLELLKEQKYKSSISKDDLCPVKNELLLMKLQDTIHEMELSRTDSSYTPISTGAHVST